MGQCALPVYLRACPKHALDADADARVVLGDPCSRCTPWSEQWQDPIARLQSFEADLRSLDICVRRGGDYDRWDLEVRGGIFGTARTQMAIEEHGAGKQLVRFRSWPVCSSGGLMLLFLFALLSSGAALDRAWLASVLLG